MIGEASGIVPDKGLNILYRGTLNTFGNITDAGLTEANGINNSSARITSDTPAGILAGMVIAVNSDGNIVKGTGTTANDAVGVAINNAVGYAFESSSSVASGKVTYIHGTGSVYATDLYEDNVASAAAGTELVSSDDGLLTALGDDTTDATQVVGIILKAATTADPFIVVQSRI
jgi:hypothetical protein